MNTLSDDGRWIGDDFLAELASQSVQNAVLGFQDPRLVLSHPVSTKWRPLTITRQKSVASFRARALLATKPPRRAAMRR